MSWEEFVEAHPVELNIFSQSALDRMDEPRVPPTYACIECGAVITDEEVQTWGCNCPEVHGWDYCSEACWEEAHAVLYLVTEEGVLDMPGTSCTLD